jgi:hypothetical protein
MSSSLAIPTITKVTLNLFEKEKNPRNTKRYQSKSQRLNIFIKLERGLLSIPIAASTTVDTCSSTPLLRCSGWRHRRNGGWKLPKKSVYAAVSY